MSLNFEPLLFLLLTILLYSSTSWGLPCSPGTCVKPDTNSNAMAKRKVENVWEYPRPAILEPCPDEIRIVHNGVEVIKTTNGMRYVPLDEISEHVILEESGGGGSFCEWKGKAKYMDLVVKGKRLKGVGWIYPTPTSKVNPDQEHGWQNYGSGKKKGTGGSFAPIANMIAFYCGPLDECYVAGEKSSPQDGGFYGGWVNSWISGGDRGIKGAPGTSHF